MVDRGADLSVLGFKSHVNYLDSFTTKKDILYLGQSRIARCIAKLGYRSTKEPYDEKEFVKRTELAMQELHPKITGIQPFSRFMSPDNTDPVLLQFKKREIPIFSKVLSTIVFTSSVNKDGSETSSYIDLGVSWLNAFRNTFKHTDWEGIFKGQAKLRPRQHHLSYRNLKNDNILYNESDNFRIMHDHRYGLMFMHKGDHKLIPVGGELNKFSKNVTRTMANSPKYGTVVFYDHLVRKKV